MRARYDSFTGRQIESLRYARLADRDRYDERTPYIARLLAQNGLADWAGLSPLEIDHLLQGYGGMPYKYMVAATDATTRIPHGAMVRVDGNAGTVTLL